MNRRFRSSPRAIPLRIWLVITPELPRAPMSAPKLIAAAIRSAGWPAAPSASSRATRTVATMFEPVSPSGTGKTFRALISSTCASRLATAAAERRQQAGAVAASPGHRPGDSDGIAGLGGVRHARPIVPVGPSATRRGADDGS